MRNVSGLKLSVFMSWFFAATLVSSCKVVNNSIKGEIAGEIPIGEPDSSVPDQFVLSPPQNILLDIINFKIDNSAKLHFSPSPLADITEAQIYLSSDNSVVEPWKTVSTGEILSTNSLHRGKKYFIKLRSKKGPKYSSAEVQSSVWTAIDELPCTDGQVKTMAIDGDLLYLGGTFTKVGPCSGGGLVFDTSTGSPSPQIKSQPTISGIVYSSVVDSSGGVYIGGLFDSVDKNEKFSLAYINPDGSVSTWAPKVSGKINTMTLTANHLIIGGAFSTVDGQSRLYIAAFNLSDRSLASWNPSGNGEVLALHTKGGIVYVGGLFYILSGTSRGYLASYNESDLTLTSWNPSPSHPIFSLTSSDTELYVGGTFSSIASQARSCLASFDLSTGNITTFNPIVNNRPLAMYHKDNILYLGGVFWDINGTPRNRLASINTITGALTSWNPNVDMHVYTMTSDGTNLYVGGAFTAIGASPRSRFASFDLSTMNLNSWNPNPNNNVQTISLLNGSKIFFGGEFGFFEENSVSRTNFAAINLLTNEVDSWSPNPSSTVYSIVVDGSTIYMGGDFSAISGVGRGKAASFDKSTKAISSWNPGLNNYVVTMHVDESTIYIGGRFTFSSGIPRNYIASFNKSDGLLTSWNPSLDDQPNSIVTSPTHIFIGGAFSTVNGSPWARTASFTKSDGIQTTWHPVLNLQAKSLIYKDGKVFIGGQFTMVNGSPVAFLTLVDDITGVVESGWNTQVANAEVLSLMLIDQTLYVGGGFSTANGGALSRKKLMSVNASDGSVTDWNPSINTYGFIFSFANYNGLVLASGTFTGHGGLFGPHGANVANFKVDPND